MNNPWNQFVAFVEESLCISMTAKTKDIIHCSFHQNHDFSKFTKIRLLHVHVLENVEKVTFFYALTIRHLVK